MGPAIRTENLTKRFGNLTAVDGLDLTVEEGEVFGFLGPNGAGKSTTINMLLDFIRPTAGRVEVLGMDANERSQEVRQRTGVLPEGFDVYDRLTGRKHVEFALESKGEDGDVDELLGRVDMLDAADRKAGGYSKGMQQRIVLAMAIAGEPDLLVLDEPTTGLDPNGAREMRELVKEEAARGATVFFSSHILEQVEAVCDRVGILRDGQFVAVDTIENLRDNVGSGDRLTVTFAGSADAAVGAVERVPGVSNVTVDGNTLALSTGESAKTDVLSALEDEGVTVEDFATEEASLEELFAAYTTDERRVEA
ncbi:ABC transporter ATP-binding protein [Halorubellus sp. JP-L1]|uniref:ABC transporter ATP-binding protein n=1 Tax=Halorubellus sp. JP-L1 TaxID=2715753 RepID=UPI0014081BF7|nr:ABC transporter ATP-binding protein [Halorubellus sp. JP-L1]NHN42251.1 ABC transporter ATP-binding protein [Halorubellus sp. JP-L1]